MHALCLLSHHQDRGGTNATLGHPFRPHCKPAPIARRSQTSGDRSSLAAGPGRAHARTGPRATAGTGCRLPLPFAKPGNVLRSYGQASALDGAAFMLGTGAAVAALTRMVPVNGSTLGSALVILLVSYLLVGGIGFLFSALWRFDWLSTGGAFGSALYLAAIFPNARWLVALPPF